MITSFDHIHLYSANLETTLTFWRDGLGAEPVGMLGRNQLLILGGQFIAVSEYPPDIQPSKPPPVGDGAVKAGFGVAHVGLNVRRIDALVPRLEAAGAEIHGETQGEPPLRFVYLTAPDGVIIELTEYVLPARLAPARALLDGFNRGVHLARRAIGKALIKAAS